MIFGVGIEENENHQGCMRLITMKNSLINNKSLVATSIAAAILAVTGATTVALNRVNNGELMMACPAFPFCYSPGSQDDFQQQETTSHKENDGVLATADSKQLYFS